VLLPGFAKFQDDDERTKQAFLRALALFTSLIFPMAAVLGVLARPLVHVLLGNQWGEAANVLPIVGGAVAFGFVLNLPAVVCEARGRLRQKIAITSTYLVVVVALVALVVYRGPTLRSLAMVFMIGLVVQEMLYLGYMKRDLSLSAMDLLIPHGEAFILAGAAGGAAWVVSALVSSPPLALLAGGASGATIWVAVMLSFKGLRARRAAVELDLRSHLRRSPRPNTTEGG
jgi:O-antigen/teichoic acid export membrane protein